MKQIMFYLPGFALALAIAAVAKFMESLLPVHLIGASVIALFLGMIVNHFHKPGKTIKPGLSFTSKKVLKFSIILLGASLSIGTILQVGRLSLTVMVFTLLTCFGGGYFVGRALKLNWKLSSLLSAGVGICGGSAIASMAPVIEAEDKDVAYSISAIFLFDMIMIVLFPILGRALGLSDIAYGLWTGTAVHDTSSVVAAGYAFSERAGDFATMVKLTRTLAIIPMVILFALVNVRLKRNAAAAAGNNQEIHAQFSVAKIFPWFILLFVALALVNSTGLIPAQFSAALKDLSKFLMVAALAAIGLNTDFREMRRSGFMPIVHGFITSLLVAFVAIAVEFCMGLV